MRPYVHPTRLLSAAASFAVFASFAAGAQAQEKPNLLIETGRHSSPITSISATKDGSLFATSSQDKTVRIWNAAGRQIQTIRPPVGGRINDVINSVAIAPDGSQVAYQFSHLEKLQEKGNFFTTFPVQVLDLKTQKVFKVARTFEPVRLSFSPNGKYLAWVSAASESDSISIEAYRTTDWELFAHANRKKTKGGTVPATLDFSPEGNRIAVTLGDETQVIAIKEADYPKKALVDKSKCDKDAASEYCQVIEAMSVAEKRMVIEKSFKPVHGKRPIGVKWSPDGKWIAYGYLDTTSVTLVATAKSTQSELQSAFLEPAYINGPETMAILAWAQDSKALYSTGTMSKKPLNSTIIRRWTLETKPTYEDGDVSTDSERKLGISGMVATSAGLAFAADGVLGFYEDGRVRAMSPLSGLRGNFGVEVTSDGEIVFFRFQKPNDILGDRYAFDALNRKLMPGGDRELPSTFYKIENSPGMENSGLLSGSPILNGVRLEIDSRSGAYAFSADGQTLLIGTSYTLYRFDRNGSKIWSVPVPARAAGLNATRDGRFALLMLDDGTLRWYRMLDGKELLAFYALNDRRSWALWTPEGYFDASDVGNLVLSMGTARPDGMVDAEPLSMSSPMRRPDKISDALTKMNFIGEAQAIPSRP